MDPRRVAKLLLGLIMLTLMACHVPSAIPTSEVWSSAPHTVSIPANVQYLAVLHPNVSVRSIADGYLRLEGIVFRLRDLRPALHVLERQQLDHLLLVQQQELRRAVMEERPLRLARLLGLDALLFFEIRTSRSDVAAQITITSKLVHLESGEVLFHSIVLSRAGRSPRGSMTGTSESWATQLALDQAITQTASDLQNAFLPLSDRRRFFPGSG